MKRLITLLLSSLFTLCIWSSDIVLVGHYLHALDSVQYKVIAEYEGDKILSLEIDVKPITLSKHTTLVIEGEKKISAFNKTLAKLRDQSHQVMKKYEGTAVTNMSEPINTSWPSIKMSGVISGEKVGYEMFDVFREVDLRAYLVIDAIMQKVVVTAEVYCPEVQTNNYFRLVGEDNQFIGYINDPKPASLTSCIMFYDDGNFNELIHLTDLSFIRERIALKQQLENK